MSWFASLNFLKWFFFTWEEKKNLHLNNQYLSSAKKHSVKVRNFFLTKKHIFSSKKNWSGHKKNWGKKLIRERSFFERSICLICVRVNFLSGVGWGGKLAKNISNPWSASSPQINLHFLILRKKWNKNYRSSLWLRF